MREPVFPRLRLDSPCLGIRFPSDSSICRVQCLVVLSRLGFNWLDLTQLDRSVGRSVVSMVGTCVSLAGSVMEEGEHTGVGPMGCA